MVTSSVNPQFAYAVKPVFFGLAFLLCKFIVVTCLYRDQMWSYSAFFVVHCLENTISARLVPEKLPSLCLFNVPFTESALAFKEKTPNRLSPRAVALSFLKIAAQASKVCGEKTRWREGEAINNIPQIYHFFPVFYMYFSISPSPSLFG